MSAEASSLAANVGLNLRDGVGGKVRQPAVLQVAPQQFHGVEVRRVGRKPDDVAARVHGQPSLHERVLVRATAIPQQDKGPAHVTREMPEEAEDLRAANIAARVQGQGEGDLAATRRDDQRADTGHLLVRARADDQLGRLAARGPRAAEHRHH